MLGAGGGTPIDASEMPRFEPPVQTFADAISPSLIDLAAACILFRSLLCRGFRSISALRCSVVTAHPCRSQ